jgi:two-component system, NarL family, invasion response regulator UvrY
MPKVLIVDDHAQVRGGLRTLFHEEQEGYIAGEAATGQEALDACRAEAWDVVLLDISMPGIGGLDVLQSLQRVCPRMPVVMMSFYIDSDHIQQCLASGAMGYMAKEEIPDQAIPAVQAVLAGRPFKSPTIEAMLAQSGKQAA